MSSPHIQIIIGSIREGRVGEPVANWFAELADARTDLSTELIDLREWNLPFLTHATPPSRGYESEIQRRWAAKVAERRPRALARRVMGRCMHLDTIEVLELPEGVEGCEECLRLGTRWVHLRMCQSCGHIGCCDNSPGRHATGHFQDTGHPIIRSAEPGEQWSWCYLDELMFRLEGS